MRILITGHTGILGGALSKATPAEHAVTGLCDPREQHPDHTPHLTTAYVDITDAAGVAQVFTAVQPQVVIHAAAVGSVNWCEEHQELAYAINVMGTEHMIAGCKATGARLLYISSNAVFDGEHAPYAEEDTVNPVNYYGKTKVLAEQAVQSSPIAKSIIRPALMYGWPPAGARDNQVTRVITSLSAGKAIEVVDDIWFNPLYAPAAAHALWRLVEQQPVPLMHLAGAQRVSLYELARITADIFALDATLVQPVSAASFSEAAPRAKDTTLVTALMELKLGIRPLSLSEGLHQMRAAWVKTVV